MSRQLDRLIIFILSLCLQILLMICGYCDKKENSSKRVNNVRFIVMTSSIY